MNRLLKLQTLLSSKWRFAVYPILALLFLSLSNFSNAQEVVPAFRVLDGIDAAFKPFQLTWQTAIKAHAQRLFWLLVGVDFAWTSVVYVLDKNTIEEIVISLVKKIFTIGFFFSLIKFCDTWIPAIIDSFRKIGQDVGGTTSTPDGLLMKGFDLATGITTLLSKLDITEKLALALPMWLCALAIFIAFCFVAAVLLVTTIESYLVVGAGVILLGFGGSRWTTDMATKYLQSAVGTGLKLMMIYLVVGAGQTIVNSVIIDSNHLIASTFVAIGTVLVYAYIVIQVPAIAAGLMSGSPALTASGLAQTALGIGAAAAGIGAAATSMAPAAAGGLGNAVAGAAGLAKALNAGMNAASDMGLSGMGAASHAIGQVVSQGAAMATNGIGSMVNSGSSVFGDKVNDSIGGKIASSIEASRGGSMSAKPAASSSGGNSAAPATGNAASGSTKSPAPSSGSAAAESARSAAQTTGSPASEFSAAPATDSAASGSTKSAASSSDSAAVESATSAAPATSSAASGSTKSAASSSGSTAVESATSAAPATSSAASGSTKSAASSSSSAAVESATSAAPATGSAASESTKSAASSSGSTAVESAKSATPATGSATSESAKSATPAIGSAASESANFGDASGASISGGKQNTGAQNQDGNERRKPAMHERIRDLEGFIPQDHAQMSAMQINAGHTQD